MRLVVPVAGLLVAVLLWAPWQPDDGAPQPAADGDSPRDPVTLHTDPKPAPKETDPPPSRTSRPTRVIRGVVRNSRGRAMPLHRVFAAPIHRVVSRSQVMSDAQGRFEFTVRTDGTTRIRCQVHPNAPLGAPVVVAAGPEDVDVVVKTYELRTLDVGVVVHSPAGPLSGVRASIGSRERLTNQEGRALFPYVREQDSIRIQVHALRPKAPLPAWNVPREDALNDVVLEVGHVTWLSGTVRSPDGKPVAADVTLLNERGDQLHARADAKTGRFRVGPAHAGTYHVEANGERHGWSVSSAQAVDLPGADVTLTVPREIRLRRRVRTRGDSEVEQAVWAAGKRRWDVKRPEIGLSSSSGPASDELQLNARIPDVRGSLYVRDADGGVAYWQDVRPEDIPAEIVTRAGETIRGTLSTFYAVKIAFVLDGISIPAEIDFGTDTYVIRGLPVGARGIVRVVHKRKVLSRVPADAGDHGLHLRGTPLPDK